MNAAVDRNCISLQNYYVANAEIPKDVCRILPSTIEIFFVHPKDYY